MGAFLRRMKIPVALKNLLLRAQLFGRARHRDLADWKARINPAPIIVLGHQKCGTSVIAALLGEISGRSVSIDLLREVKRPTFQHVHSGTLSLERFIRTNRLEFSRDIVKEANLTPMYQALRLRFPSARFAFVIRDPRDNIRSILQRLRLPGRPEQSDPTVLANVSPAWRLVLHGDWLGLHGKDYVEMLAARWEHFAEIALAAGAEVESLRYEDFCADKAAAIGDFARRLGLPADHDIAGRTEVQYQSRGDHRNSWVDYFGAHHLTRIESICARGMAAFGYSASGSKTTKP